MSKSIALMWIFKKIISSTFVDEYLHKKLGYAHVFQSFERDIWDLLWRSYLYTRNSVGIRLHMFHMFKFNEIDRKKGEMKYYVILARRLLQHVFNKNYETILSF